MLTGGQLAALLVAVFWAILVCFLCLVLVRLHRVLEETTKLVSTVTERTVPLLDRVTTTVTRVDRQVERTGPILRNVESITRNAAKLSTVLGTVVGVPLTRAASLSYGVRRALGDERGRGEGSGEATVLAHRNDRRAAGRGRRREARARQTRRVGS